MTAMTSAGGRFRRSGAAGTLSHPGGTFPVMATANTMCLQAASPDEEALVQGAATLGFRLLTRSLEKVGGQAAHAAHGTCSLRHVSSKVVDITLHDSADTTKQTSHRLVRACCLLQPRWFAGSQVTCCSAGGH